MSKTYLLLIESHQCKNMIKILTTQFQETLYKFMSQ